VGVRRPLAVAAVLLSVALPVASAPAQPPDRAALLQTYLPVLVFHPDERWPPSGPEPFVGASRLEERGATGGWPVSSRTSLPDSSVPCARVPCFRLNLQPCVLRAGPTCYRTLAGKLGSWAQPVVFGNVVDVRTTPADLRGLPEPPRTLVRYWLFFDVDDWSSTRPGGLWQLHEGDWESVTVGLGAAGVPLFVATSRHCRGGWRPWSRVPLAGGTHPRVFVAVGSHAGYFAAGSQRNFPLACAKAGGELGRVIDLARRAGVRSSDRTGSGRSAGPPGLAQSTLRLVDLGAGDDPAWARFAGVWSEGEILYLRTLGVTRTATYGEGPRTPAFDADVTGTILGSWIAE
jgi:hypothetical protein